MQMSVNVIYHNRLKKSHMIISINAENELDRTMTKPLRKLEIETTST